MTANGSPDCSAAMIARSAATHVASGSSLFVEGDEALEDIAHFVGHAKPATTAGYVKRLGRRPEAVARRAATVLDGLADEDETLVEGGVRNQPGEFGSNGGSYRSDTTGSPANGEGP
jgi:hypothetical protein